MGLATAPIVATDDFLNGSCGSMRFQVLAREQGKIDVISGCLNTWRNKRNAGRHDSRHVAAGVPVTHVVTGCERHFHIEMERLPHLYLVLISPYLHISNCSACTLRSEFEQGS